MAGLSANADFLAATRDVRMVGKDVMLNEATKGTYFFFSRMLRKAYDKFKGGTKLVDKIQGKTSGSFAWYDPNDEFSPEQKDVTTQIAVEWAFAKADYTLIDETIQLNAGDSNAYFSYVKSLELDCMVSKVNGLEESLWSKPKQTKMEASAATQREMYSIPAYVTRDGEVPAAGNGGLHADDSTAWTTIAPVTPGNDAWYKNASTTYTLAPPDDADAGLLASFDNMSMQVEFEMPSGIQNWSSDETINNQVICTSRDGVVFYKSRLRASNDRMERLRDPGIVGPQFEGIPVRRVTELDGHGWTNNQPDYFWLNLNYMYPYFHTNRFMSEKITVGGPKQPNSTVVYKFSWVNLICRSRRRQGRIYGA